MTAESGQWRVGADKKWLVWVRLLCVVATAGFLYLVFRRLKLSSLVQALRSMQGAWFLAAILVYGALFVPASIRWHLLLRLNRVALRSWITARTCLIGHFFYVTLFGAVGGDAARSALYAHWYRQPLTGVLATAPLDRLLGFLGLLLFGLAAVLLAVATGGYARLGAVGWQWQGLWLLGVLVLCLGVWWFLSRAKPGSFLNRFARDLTTAGRLLLRAPKVGAAGVLCGLSVQLCLSATLAFNLQAVSHSPLPWEQMIWAFPIIALLGALPITVAGLGAREGAALLLLGVYGISSATAVAASLLTLAASLLWAVVGGLLLWIETRKQAGSRRVLLPAAGSSNA